MSSNFTKGKEIPSNAFISSKPDMTTSTNLNASNQQNSKKSNQPASEQYIYMHSAEHWRLKDPTSNPLGEVVPPIQGLGLGAQRSSQDILVNFLFCLLPLLEPSNGSHWILQIRPSSVNQENQAVKENSQRQYKPINHKHNLKPTKNMTNKWNIHIKK